MSINRGFAKRDRFCPSDQREFRIDADGIAFDRAAVEPPREEEVKVCLDFLSRCQPAKTTGRGSYGLKHVIEDSEATYISNGAAIEVAYRAGFRLWVAATGENLSAIIGITKTSVEEAAAK